MYFNPHALKIYTDGSALKNPGGPGGIAGIIDYPDHLELEWCPVFSQGYKQTTNNRMELRACIKGLECLEKEANRIREFHKILITDSLYVSENYKRASYWKKDGWINRYGRPVENSDLWDSFISIRRRVGGEIQWVKGKSDNITNAVDKLAKKAARNPSRIDFGYAPGRVTPKKSGDKTATLLPAKGQILSIWVYRRIHKKTKNKEWHKIYFNILNESNNSYFGNYFAYYPYENKIHTRRCYVATFNNKKELPIIKELVDK